MTFVSWGTSIIGWGATWAYNNPAETVVVAVAVRYAPVPTARIAWALIAEYGPASLSLSSRVAQIAYEEFAIVRGGTHVVTKGVPLLAAAALGWGIGAVVGTAIISQAEKKKMVYEGATADVIDFYLPGGKGHYFETAPPPGDPTGEPRPGYFNIGGNIEYILQNQFGIEKGGGIKQFF
tara:strand:- start:7 stop:543 length:537 start_codon:yes stop_codon:yes gene_type:complete